MPSGHFETTFFNWSGLTHSIITRKKMSESQKGIPKSKEQVLKMVETRKRNGSYGQTIETRKKISIATRGEKSHLWKGGLTEKNMLIRQGVEYRNWRNAVYKRDNYTCRICGQLRGELNAHHIKSFSEFPELRFDIENGVTLCIGCHSKTDNYFKRINY